MYYDVVEIERILICPFCSTRFDGKTRLIPECGNSICGRCYENNLKKKVRKLSQYKCRVCDSEHTMPQKGLPDNKQLSQLAVIKPKEGSLGEKTEPKDPPQEKPIRRPSFLRRTLRRISSRFRTKKDPTGLVNLSRPDLKQPSTETTPIALKKISLEPSDNSTWSRIHSIDPNLSHLKEVNQVLFLPDGRLASCSNDKTIKIWKVENGEVLFQLKGHTDRVLSLALLPNGHLASGSTDMTIRIWDLERENEIRAIPAHSSSVRSLCVLKNGYLASFACDNTVKIWDLDSKNNEPVLIRPNLSEQEKVDCHVSLFGILSNDSLVTCSPEVHSNLHVWNSRDSSNSIKRVPLNNGFDHVRSLLVLTNDQVALGFEGGSIQIINLNDRSKIEVKAYGKEVSSLAELANGKLLSAGLDGLNSLCIKVWNRDLSNSKFHQVLIHTSHSELIRSLGISADQKYLASGSEDGFIKLWPISKISSSRGIGANQRQKR